MSQDQARVSVRIMEKEYVVACPYDERAALLDAAEFLKVKDREAKAERGAGQRVRALRERVEGALGKSQQLDL